MIEMTDFLTAAICKMYSCVETLFKLSIIGAAIRYLRNFSSWIDQAGMKEAGVPIKSMIFERLWLVRKFHIMES